MNKQQFIENLGRYFASLPEEDQLAILREYEAYFHQGNLEGRSEEELVQELGHPLSLAKEALFAGIPSPMPDPTHAPLHAPFPGPLHEPISAPLHEPYPPAYINPSPNPLRLISVTIGLFFLNTIVAVPVFATTWALFISLCAVVIATFLSPFAYGAEVFLYDGYSQSKLMLAIGMVGVSMLLAAPARAIGKWMILATIKYVKWNYATWRGRA